MTLRFKRAELLFAVMGAVIGAFSGLMNVLEDGFSFRGAVAHVIAWSLGTSVWITLCGIVWRAIVSGRVSRREAVIGMGLAMTIGGGLGGAISGALSAAVNRPASVLEDALSTALGVAGAGLICGPILGALFVRARRSGAGGSS
jgi:hypothetical protein